MYVCAFIYLYLYVHTWLAEIARGYLHFFPFLGQLQAHVFIFSATASATAATSRSPESPGGRATTSTTEPWKSWFLLWEIIPKIMAKLFRQVGEIIVIYPDRCLFPSGPNGWLIEGLFTHDYPFNNG